MKVSVVIPAYNEEKYIGKTLDSLKNQIYKDYEIIVSDGGSTDKTGEIVKKYGYKFIIHKNQTIPFARQKGIEDSTGEIIVGCDADTIYPPDHLAKIILDFDKDPNIVAVGGPAEFPKDIKLVYWYWRFFYNLVNKLIIFLHVTPYIPALNLSFKRKTFFDIGGYKTYLDFGGDELDIVGRLAKVGKIFYDDKLRPTASNRRSKVGIFRLVLKETIIDYWIGYFLAKIFHRTIIKGKYVR